MCLKYFSFNSEMSHFSKNGIFKNIFNKLYEKYKFDNDVQNYGLDLSKNEFDNSLNFLIEKIYYNNSRIVINDEKININSHDLIPFSITKNKNKYSDINENYFNNNQNNIQNNNQNNNQNKNQNDNQNNNQYNTQNNNQINTQNNTQNNSQNNTQNNIENNIKNNTQNNSQNNNQNNTDFYKNKEELEKLFILFDQRIFELQKDLNSIIKNEFNIKTYDLTNYNINLKIFIKSKKINFMENTNNLFINNDLDQYINEINEKIINSPKPEHSFSMEDTVIDNKPIIENQSLFYINDLALDSFSSIENIFINIKNINAYIKLINLKSKKILEEEEKKREIRKFFFNI